MRRRRSRDPVPILLRRRQRFRLAGAVLAVVVAATALLDRLGAFGHAGDDWGRFDGQSFVVDRVIDGDTLDLRGGTRVRLIGVDAPEFHHDQPERGPDHWAERARNYLAARADDKPVTVRLDGTQTRDRYGRLLAYLYLSDNDPLNLALVRDGQAYADRRFRHAMTGPFEQAENAARSKGTGLWKDVREAQMPPWRQRWLAERRQSRERQR